MWIVVRRTKTMFGNFPGFYSQLAVVPIVVNVSVALLPAIIAAITSFLAILFKPKELIHLCRAKPWIPLFMFVIVGTVGILIWLWSTPAQHGTGSRQRTSDTSVSTDLIATMNIDWTKIALEHINAQRRKPIRLTEAKKNKTNRISADNPFIFRAGSKRLGSLGADLSGPMQKTWHYYPRWIDETGIEQEDTEAMILSSPAFYNNHVYAASCLLDPPDNYGAIFCLDAATGRQIWSVSKIEGQDIKGFFSSPALTADGRYLLIGQGLHPDSNCHLFCIDTETGQIHWTLQVPLHIESSPAIYNDTVYVGCGAIEDPTSHKPLSHPGFVLAVDISDGQERWRFEVADPESSPIVQDGVLYIGSGFNGQAVVALDIETDKQNRLLWRTPTPYPITGAITLMEETVIAGGGNGDFVYRDPNPAGVVMALDKTTGQILWTTDTPDAVLGAVAAGPFLICPVASGQVMALDPQTGIRQWDTTISKHAPVLAACTISGQSVYAVSQDGYLAKLDLKTGELLDKQYINTIERPGAQGLSISSPLVVQGSLYVGSETGGLRCYHGEEKR